jgi:anion-transporting  ArsA/GET3 family ATPase
MKTTLKDILKEGCTLEARKLTKREIKAMLKKLETIQKEAERRRRAIANQDLSKIIITI